MNFDTMKRHAGYISGKLLFALAFIICLALGLIGLVLPIIPGILFLGIAALMLAPYVPALNNWMHRSPYMRHWLDEVHALKTLQLRDQLRLGALLSLRMMLDGARYIAAQLGRLFSNFGRNHLYRSGARRGYCRRAY